MKIIEAATDKRDEALIDCLMEVWRKSVLETHTFLSVEEVDGIAQYVPGALEQIPVLILAEVDGRIAGFAGVDGVKLEMLFLDPEIRGQGMGKQLVKYATEHYQIAELCVNEQNPQARGFYEHMGFQVYRREPLDEQGNPYPLLYMRLQGGDRNDTI